MLRTKEPLRNRLETEFDTLVERTTRMVASHDTDSLGRRPDENAWSAAECIDHLNETARLYLDPLGAAIADARSRGLTGDRPDGRTLLGRVIVWAMEPPPRLKMGTFAELEPAADHDPAELAATFADVHGRLVDQMKGAADVDRKKVKVRSLLDSRLKLSLDDWYAFLAAHARRHLWQAERALEPASGDGRHESR